MSQKRLVAIPCKLSPGMFSSERLFEVKMADGKAYHGVTPSHFCWNIEGKLVAVGEPSGEEIGGFIAARVVEKLDENQYAVELPDGEVVAVWTGDVKDRPTPIEPPKPKQVPHVPVGS